MHTYLYLKTKWIVFTTLILAIYRQCVSEGRPSRRTIEHRLELQGVPHPGVWSWLIVSWNWSADYTFKDLFHLSLGMIAVLGDGMALYALDPLTALFACLLFGGYVIWCMVGMYCFLNRKMVQTVSANQ